MKSPLTHARDRIVTHGQKTVTALCFKRVATGRTVYLPSGHPFNCVGCAAIAAAKYAESGKVIMRESKVFLTGLWAVWQPASARRGSRTRRERKEE